MKEPQESKWKCPPWELRAFGREKEGGKLGPQGTDEQRVLSHQHPRLFHFTLLIVSILSCLIWSIILNTDKGEN